MDTQTPGRQKADEGRLGHVFTQGPVCVLAVIAHVVILMSHHRGTTTGSRTRTQEAFTKINVEKYFILCRYVNKT